MEISNFLYPENHYVIWATPWSSVYIVDKSEGMDCRCENRDIIPLLFLAEYSP